eukprot:343134_1
MAQMYCRSKNSNLASITTQDELTTVLNSAEINWDMSNNAKQMWLGLNDIKTENNWVQIDGTECNYENILNSEQLYPCKSDRNWIYGYPKYSTSNWYDCAYLHKGGYYNTHCQNVKYNFICNDENSVNDGDVGYTYTLYETTKTWSEAEQDCQSNGGHLATITNFDDLAAILDANGWDMDNTQYWIGLNDLTTEGTWEWSSGRPCDYTSDGSCKSDRFWTYGEPLYQNTASYDCAYFKNGQYGAMNCIVENKYICANGVAHEPIRTCGAANEMCLQIEIDQSVSVYNCDDSTEQQWSYDNIKKTIVNKVMDGCLSFVGNGNDGDKLQVIPCDDTNVSQQWNFQDDITTGTDKITNQLNGKCIDISGSCYWKAENACPAQIWNCNGGDINNKLFCIGTAIDCIVSQWGDWTQCSVSCGGGIQTRSRTVVTEADNGGAICDPLQETQNCNEHICSDTPTISPTKPPIKSPTTVSPTKPPTKPPVIINCVGETQCCPNGIGEFDWDILTTTGVGIPEFNVVFDINENDLLLNIEVELEYMGYARANDMDEAKFGVTYVLDFEDYDAHEDKIAEPGSCENRLKEDFIGNNFEDFWKYSKEPQNDNVGTSDFLAYPPVNTDLWNIEMKQGNCDMIVYRGSFTWQELRNCKSYNNNKIYTQINGDNNWLNLTGVFYINLVSPFWYGNQDMGYYRVYQIYSQPWVIAVSSSVYVLGQVGVNLISIGIIGVYKQDQETDFKLVIITETAQYMQLIRDVNDLFEFVKDDTINTNNIYTSDFSQNIIAETGNNCLENKGFVCTQLWEISANNIECTINKGTDFTGEYWLDFTPQCRINHKDYNNCIKWLDDHTEIKDGITLKTPLTWHDDICDPQIFTVQFDASMYFYTDENYQNIAQTDTLYQVGEDRIYVSVTATFPSNTLEIFNTELISVWICTFRPGFQVPMNQNDLTTMGCLNSERDTEKDKYFKKIYDKFGIEEIVNDHQFKLNIQESITNIEQFSFIVPSQVERDTIYIHAQIEVELIQEGLRRRLLLNVENTANQIQHFGYFVGVKYNNNNNKKPIKLPEKPSPIVTTVPSSLGKVISFCIFIAMLLVLICIAFIFRNKSIFNSVNVRRQGYKSVKIVDSDLFSESEANIVDIFE